MAQMGIIPKANSLDESSNIQNKGKYLWTNSANIIIFNCTSKTIAEDAITSLNSGRSWKDSSNCRSPLTKATR